MSAPRPLDEGRVYGLAAGGFGLMLLLLLGDLLLLPGERVASSELGDVAYYFARVRRFAVLEFASGNFPLWNPYIFSGLPFFGGFQAALLYPLNVIYLVLPLAKAINLDFALHLFITGFATFAWVRHRAVHPLAAFFAGVLAMFCGATLLRVFAGQPTLVAANAWTPLLLLVVDRTLERPTLRWCLVGIAAATLQILAGYPFAVFATGFVGGVYALLRLRDWQSPLRVIAALGSIAVVPLLISAAQLWTGAQTSWETTRAGGVPYEFAASYSLPLESLFTTLVPELFGDGQRLTYWGRWWFWDTSIFLGITALCLAAIGARYGPPQQRRFALPLAVLLLLLAFGDYAPLFDFCYRFVPGFDSFRAPSKFAFHASLFVAMLSAIGLDRLLREPRGAKGMAALAALCALGLAAGGTWLRVEALSEPGGGLWGDLVETVEPWLYSEALAREAASFAERAMHVRAGVCAALALLLALRMGTRWAAYGVALLGVIELLVFASDYRGGLELRDLERPELETFYRAHPGDHRFFTYAKLDRAQDNYALDARVPSLWGYDPVQLARYARFLEFAREETNDFETPSVANQPDEIHPLFRLLRLRYAQPRWGPKELTDALPRFLLLDDYRVLPKEEILPALLDPTFDPARTVLLETPPEPAPRPGGGRGRVSLVEEGTDHFILDVALPAPAILLITDTWSAGWIAEEVATNPPVRFDVLPADYVVRAIPLPAGTRRLRVEYAPTAFRVGRWVSVVSLALFLAVASMHGLWWVQARSSSRGSIPNAER